MRCPRCQSDLPDAARFCGVCGHRFSPAAGPGFSDAGTEERDLRFFRDTSEPTDPERAKVLLDAASRHGVSTPPPPQAPAPVTLPEVVPPRSMTPAKPAPFQLAPKDLAVALDRAAGSEGKPAPEGGAPEDVNGFYKAGERLGISRKTLEAALQHVALERLGHKPEPPVVAPLTAELQAIQPSRGKILGMSAAVLLGVTLLIVATLKLNTEPPAASPASPAAGAGDPDKPRRKPGQLDPKLIQPAIAAVGERARACHEEARKRSPHLEGRILLDVELEEDGTFSKLDVKEDGVKDPAMLECVKQEIRGYGWPKPTGGFVAMEFPLSFQVAEERKGGGGKPAGKGGKKH